MTPRVILLTAPGTNCQEETVLAFRRLGASVDELPLAGFARDSRSIHEAEILVLPGGFSFGDALGAGTVWSQALRNHRQEVWRFHSEGKLVLGICNGFQALLRAGMLPDFPRDEGVARRLTLTLNESGRYECRWVRLSVRRSPCPLFEEGRIYQLPVAHAEGNLRAESEAVIAELEASGQVPLAYCGEHGLPSLSYPANPNGSMGAVAALCDASGRIVGMMPHPERFQHPYQHPGGRSRTGVTIDGLEILEGAIRYVKTHC